MKSPLNNGTEFSNKICFQNSSSCCNSYCPVFIFSEGNLYFAVQIYTCFFIETNSSPSPPTCPFPPPPPHHSSCPPFLHIFFSLSSLPKCHSPPSLLRVLSLLPLLSNMSFTFSPTNPLPSPPPSSTPHDWKMYTVLFRVSPAFRTNRATTFAESDSATICVTNRAMTSCSRKENGRIRVVALCFEFATPPCKWWETGTQKSRE